MRSKTADARRERGWQQAAHRPEESSANKGAMSDTYNLQRFVDAQSSVYECVQRELRAGCKTGHWMWFIFPQIQGLGSSAMAQRYAIGSLGEAKAYLEHSILGARLIECTQLLLDVKKRTLAQIVGYPDNLKFRSCMTLFAHAGPERTIFGNALRQYCGGREDEETVKIIALRARFSK